jgi:hypothetical protein
MSQAAIMINAHTVCIKEHLSLFYKTVKSMLINPISKTQLQPKKGIVMIMM